MSFHFDRQGFVFEEWHDWVIAYPITAAATIWLSLIDEALWPTRDRIYVNWGRVVPKTEWAEFFMEVYKAGWRWGCDEFHEGKCRSILPGFWNEK